MKKIAFFVVGVAVFCGEAFGMGEDKREVFFKVVSSDIEGNIVAKVPEREKDLKLSGPLFQEGARVEIIDPSDDAVATSGSGVVEVYSSGDESKKLLEFNVEKLNGYTPAKVSLQNSDDTVKAVLYRPSMGGGDNFVLAIGRVGSDLSVSKMQRVLPFGSIQMFFPVCTIGQRD